MVFFIPLSKQMAFVSVYRCTEKKSHLLRLQMNLHFIKSVRYFLFVSLFTLLAYGLTAQEHYEDGFLVSLNGDTVSGQIDNRNWNINPHVIRFRSSAGLTPVELGPLSIREFHVGQEVYISAIVEFEASDLHTERLTSEPEPDIRIDTVFLQTLFKGEKSLYLYRAKGGRENYYIWRDGGLDLLLYKRYLLTTSGAKGSEMTTRVAENLHYIGQLKNYFRGNAELEKTAEITSYTQSGLTKLFDAYYLQSSNSWSFRKEEDRVGFKFGLTAGYELYHLDFEGYIYDYLVATIYPWSGKTCFGAFLELQIPRHHLQFSIVNELLYSRFLSEGRVTLYVNDENYSTYDTRLGVSYLKLSNMVRYYYPMGKGMVLVDAGFSNGLGISSINEFSRFKKLYSMEYTETGVALENMRLYEFSVSAGLGYRFRNYALELRYEMGGGLSDYLQLISNIDRVFIKAEYHF